MSLEEVFKYIDTNSKAFVNDLVKLVKQPSVSARGEGVQECAELVAKMLKAVGAVTKILPEKDGNPVVYGEIKSKTAKKTLLFYDHYDVQPPEPLEEWNSGPFSGEIREGKIYGRGASDNKGNFVSRLKAVEAFLKTQGDIPVNVKFVVEGEEEIGSPHLEPVIRENKRLLSADAAIWEFGGTDRHGRPDVYLGLKGVLSVDLQCQAAVKDVHSANAPLVPSPVWRLVWALNTLKNEKEEILIEGFYDNVERPSKKEIECLKDIPFEEEEEKKELGLKDFLHNLTGVEAVRALLYQPTCTINGIISGYTGAGSKTVLPNKAMAKLDFRLVARQTPDEIVQKLRKHLRKHGFGDVKMIMHGSTEPTKTPITDSFVKTVVKTAGKAYGQKAVVYPTSAGSGPMHLFRNLLGYPVVSVGCSHSEANGHAPNENLRIDSFVKGTKFMAMIMQNFGTS